MNTVWPGIHIREADVNRHSAPLGWLREGTVRMEQQNSSAETIAAPSRRDFSAIARMSAAAGVSLAALSAARRAHAATAITDADIFNFALNFEYLGAEYYLQAVLGYGLKQYDPSLITGSVGTQGTVTVPTGSTLVPFTDSAVAYFAIQLANDELAHVRFIRAALGTDAIAEPSIDFTTAYTKIAMSAGLIGAGQTFNPFSSEINFLLGAYLIEDVCVTALAGAASLLQSKTNLAYAAGLLGAESQQAGAIRGFLSQFGQGQATDKISALRAALSGTPDEGTADQNNNYNISNGDSEAQAVRRTPAQVLAIAYGAPGVTSGGIFPAGVNYSNPALASS